MAQLSSDSFAFGGALRRLDDALNDLTARLPVVADAETVRLEEALGRVLAETCCSPARVPNFDNSAVDGYAVRASDLAAGGVTRLPVGTRIPAGMLAVPPLKIGEAARIFTGAMMPDGADTVFMQEDVTAEKGDVLLPSGLKAGSNRRFAGEDFALGAPVVLAGTRLKPQHIAGLAAAGFSPVMVRKPLRVALFSTGDEIRDRASLNDATDLPKGCQFDSNRPMLRALLAMRGIAVRDLGVLPDDRAIITRALADAAQDCDAILTSGGVSTGEEDHVKAAVEAAGRLDFWRLAIKPGRPIAMGTINQVPLLGMPGNPAAVFITFTRFVGPVLDMLAGAKPLRPRAFVVQSGFDYKKKADRREYVRVFFEQDASGVLTAQRFPKDGAALISSLIAADALVELEEERISVKAGDMINVLPINALLS